MSVKKVAFLLPCALLAGCFTLKQTPMPQVEMSRAPQGADVKVAVSGFATTVTDYIPVYGHQTVYVDHGPYYGRHGRRYWGGGHYETVTSETMVPQVRIATLWQQSRRGSFERPRRFCVKGTWMSIR